jgi:hypothetical protein
MKVTLLLRASVLVLAACGAAIFWVPFLLTNSGNGRVLEYFFGQIDPLWFDVALICLIVTVPLSVLSLWRRDYIGVFGLAAALSVGLMIWYLNRRFH